MGTKKKPNRETILLSGERLPSSVAFSSQENSPEYRKFRRRRKESEACTTEDESAILLHSLNIWIHPIISVFDQLATLTSYPPFRAF